MADPKVTGSPVSENCWIWTFTTRMRVPILITGNGKVPCEYIVHAVLLAMPRIKAASARPIVAGTAVMA